MILSDAESLQPPDAVTHTCPLVLAGAGHAHLVMMRLWIKAGWRPPAGTVLINAGSHAWYSGMMPGLIAGRFGLDECAIALLPLCQRLGITLVQASVTALDSQHQRVVLDNGEHLHYQLLSINTGSQPVAPAQLDGSVNILPAKPFPEFIHQWQRWQTQAPGSVMVLGGGAAAFELAMALRQQFPASELSLACSGDLLQSHGPALRTLALQWLTRADIAVFEHNRVDAVRHQQAFAGELPLMRIDALILATGASALPWYSRSALPCDSQGFINVDRCLRSSDARVFAAGDAASLAGSLRSGVYSVRHGPVLAHNLRAAVSGQALLEYTAQSNALALLATGNGGAMMSYGRFALGSQRSAPLLGRWKDYLDQSFMRRHRLADQA